MESERESAKITAEEFSQQMDDYKQQIRRLSTDVEDRTRTMDCSFTKCQTELSCERAALSYEREEKMSLQSL